MTGVHDDPDNPPAPGRDAPKGWAWDRKGRRWQPRQRGPVLWTGDGQQDDEAAAPSPDGGSQQRDPAPAWQQHDAPDARPKHDPGKVPGHVKDDLRGVIGLFGMFVLPRVEAADPHCGGALVDNYEAIAERLVPLLCRSERVVKFLTADSGGMMDWIGLAMALAPVGRAVAEHHVFRTVEVVRDEETGRKVARAVDLSQYAAA